MKKHPYKFLFALCMAVNVILVGTQTLAAREVQVFILGGQSNMVGQAKASDLPESLQGKQEDVHFYFMYKNEVSGLGPLRPGSGNQFGPEVTFGRAILDAFPDKRFALIKYAVNGSNLYSHWHPTDERRGVYYKKFQQVVQDGLDAIKAQGDEPVIVGMLWSQGEADAHAGRTSDQYHTDLTAFIADIRQRYGDGLPFYFNRLSQSQKQIPPEKRAAICQAQDAVASEDDHAYLILTDDLSQSDTVHFNAKGQMELGKRFAEICIKNLQAK